MQPGEPFSAPPPAHQRADTTSSSSPALILPTENLVVQARNDVNEETRTFEDHGKRVEQVREDLGAFGEQGGGEHAALADEVGKVVGGRGQEVREGSEPGEEKLKTEGESEVPETHGNGLVDQTNYLPPRCVNLLWQRPAR